MSIVLSPRELIDISISIEHLGIAFYDTLSHSTDKPSTAELFHRLADMERGHIAVFEQMIKDTSGFNNEESCETDQSDYLKAISDNAVFTNDMATSEAISRIDDDIQAIELAIQAEKDSIIFYYELQDILPQKKLISDIITEEKNHLRLLNIVKNELKK